MTLSLEWVGDLKFRSGPGSPPIELHSSTPGVVSPVEALAYALMGCMAMDVAHVLARGRHALDALTVTFEGTRAATHPRRYLGMTLHFDLTADVAGHVVERAIELSRTRYCPVWNSLQPDIVLTTTYSVRPPSTDRSAPTKS